MLTIKERLKPFSHRPGTACLIPGTTWVITAYPTRIELSHLESEAVHAWDLGLTGPVEKFTVEQNLENGKVFIFGHALEGYFRYAISAEDGRIVCNHLRGVGPELLSFPASVKPYAKPEMRLSLGNHKKPDWDLITRREDLREILPLWFALGQSLPRKNATFSKKSFLDLFRAHFRGMLVPQKDDPLHQGITPELLDPICLLSTGAAAIRKMFIEVEGGKITLLPNLPKEFHCGCLLGVPIAPSVTLDLEWSKKQVRRILIHAEKETRLVFYAKKGIEACKVNQKSCYQLGQELQVVGDVLLDRFTK